MSPCSLRYLSFAAVLFACQVNSLPSFAQDVAGVVLSQRHHPWTRFEPGAWRTTELTTETLGVDGKVSSQTIITRLITLEALRNQRYSLREETVVDTRGRQVNGKPRVSWHNMFFDDESDAVAVELAKPEIILLNDQRITCRVLQARLTGSNQHKTARLFIDDVTSPYIFRREIHETQVSQDAGSPRRSVQEVIAVDMPYPYRGNVISTAHVRSVVTSSKGKIIRLSIVSDDVPGGVVAEWSKELDRDGRVLRRGYLELTDYGRKAPPKRAFRRRLTGRRGR